MRTLDDRIGISHEEKERKDREPAPTLPVEEPLIADRQDHLFPRPEGESLKPNSPPGASKMEVPELLYNRGEVHNLTVRRGTLTEEDRYKINEHIVQTIKMLDQLPPAAPARGAGDCGRSPRKDGWDRLSKAADRL